MWDFRNTANMAYFILLHISVLFVIKISKKNLNQDTFTRQAK